MRKRITLNPSHRGWFHITDAGSRNSPCSKCGLTAKELPVTIYQELEGWRDASNYVQKRVVRATLIILRTLIRDGLFEADEYESNFFHTPDGGLNIRLTPRSTRPR